MMTGHMLQHRFSRRTMHLRFYLTIIELRASTRLLLSGSATGGQRRDFDFATGGHDFGSSSPRLRAMHAFTPNFVVASSLHAASPDGQEGVAWSSSQPIYPIGSLYFSR